MSEDVRVIGVVEVPSDTVDTSMADKNGIVSCKVISYDELDDETLEILFDQSPDVVREKRPDWIKTHHPSALQIN